LENDYFIFIFSDFRNFQRSSWLVLWMVIFDGWTKVTASLLEVNNEIRGRPPRDVGNVAAGEK
jgi:hypothetical protein